MDVTDTPYVFMPEIDRTNHYVFIQDVWNIANDWELTAGVRYDDYSDFGSTTNPRLALVWSTSLNFSTKLLYGKAFRAPAFVETNAINNPVQLGNPTLKPEEIETIELAFDYHPGRGFGMVLNFYRYEWNDIIQQIPDVGASTSTFQNFGKQTAYGAEFEINWLLSEEISLASNFSWSDATNEKTNQDVAYVPNQQIYVQLNWKISDTLKLNFKNNLVLNRKRDVEDPRNSIDDYWLSDVNLRWMPTDSPIELALIGKNIFNEDVREPTINNGAVVSLPEDLPMPGRMIYGELRYQF